MIFTIIKDLTRITTTSASVIDPVLILTMPNFLNGIIRLALLALSTIFLGISRSELKVGQPTVQSLVRLHGCAG